MSRSYPILYTFRRCPYAMRARLALVSSKQQCELREIVLRNKPDEMVAASPKATVPVLIDVDGAVLEESLDIMLWSLNRNDPEGWLDNEGDKLNKALSLIERIDGSFKSNLDRYKYSARHSNNEDEQSAQREKFRTLALEDLGELEVLLNENIFLYGDKITIADMAIAPFVRQFANTDFDWFAQQDIPKIQSWLEEFVSSQRFKFIFKKFDLWQSNTLGIAWPDSSLPTNE